MSSKKIAKHHSHLAFCYFIRKHIGMLFYFHMRFLIQLPKMHLIQHYVVLPRDTKIDVRFTFLFTDWFDGLHTFMRYICHKSWLGGWLLPQKKSYFALQLPKGWWIFGLDLALHCDIDVYQFKFFAELCKDKVHFSSNFHLWYTFYCCHFCYDILHVGLNGLYKITKGFDV